MIEVIKFSAPWCGPCKGFQPTWNSAVKNYPGVVFSEINCDESTELVAKFGVRSVPTFVLLENGKEVDRMAGANSTNFYDMLNRWV